MAVILVPTDFSETAAKALNYAEMLAKKMNSDLFLFHSFNKAAPDGAPEANDRLDALAKEVRQRTGRDCLVETRQGNSAEEIIKAAERNCAGFIVMGATGVNGIERKIWGGTASKVILKSKLPVIAVPEAVSRKSVKRIEIGRASCRERV